MRRLGLPLVSLELQASWSGGTSKGHGKASDKRPPLVSSVTRGELHSLSDPQDLGLHVK